jgi:hypothetical protein
VATATTPPRQATPTRRARRHDRQAPGNPCPAPADCPDGRPPGVKGAFGVAARALRAPGPRGNRPRDLAAVKAMGLVRHAPAPVQQAQAKRQITAQSQAQQQQELDRAASYECAHLPAKTREPAGQRAVSRPGR